VTARSSGFKSPLRYYFWAENDGIYLSQRGSRRNNLTGSIVKTIIKLGVVGAFAMIALIMVCGGIGSQIARNAPDPTPPPAPAVSVAFDRSDSDTPIEHATIEPDPIATQLPPAAPSDTTSEYETVDYATLPENALLQAVTRCREIKQPPEKALATKSSQLRLNTIVYMHEGAEVLTVGSGLGVQFLLEDGTTAFLSGVSQRGFITGKRYIPGLVYVTDTASYTSLFGAGRSGWVLRNISDSEWANAEQAVDEIMRVNRRNDMRDELVKLEEQLANQRPDKLVSADGNHTTEAIIVSYSDGEVTLIKTDGKEITVALDRLNASSQDIVRSKVGRRATAKKRIENIKKELSIL